MRRRIVEIVMSIGAVGLILLVLISYDTRVREEASRRWESGPTAELVAVGLKAGHMGSTVAQAFKGVGLAGTPVLLFIFGAGVLVLFMVKT
jgi:hypothetical protein